jgi:hypothetical protein
MLPRTRGLCKRNLFSRAAYLVIALSLQDFLQAGGEAEGISDGGLSLLYLLFTALVLWRGSACLLLRKSRFSW